MEALPTERPGLGIRTAFHFYQAALDWARRRLSKPVICSKCFGDYGIQYTAAQMGAVLSKPCIRCGQRDGVGLNADQAYELMHRFFERGTYRHGAGGYSPSIRLCDPVAGFAEVHLHPNTAQDRRLLTEITGTTIFDFGPTLWRVGMTSHWDFEDETDELNWKLAPTGISLALNACPDVKVGPGDQFFRARLNVPGDRLTDAAQYDTPPEGLKKQYDRFDAADIPIFYAGRSLEVCLHETRLSNRDEVTLATCEFSRPAKLLDITGDTADHGETPFDDPMHFFNGLMFSNHTFDECRMVAQAIRERGYDGFLYKSYHSPLMLGGGVNIALFGWPIRDGLVSITSLNNIFIEEIKVAYQLGPLVPGAYIEEPQSTDGPVSGHRRA